MYSDSNNLNVSCLGKANNGVGDHMLYNINKTRDLVCLYTLYFC